MRDTSEPVGERVCRIYVRRPSGAVRIFHAIACAVSDGLVIATGRWSNRPRSTPRQYAWSAAQILEVRWDES